MNFFIVKKPQGHNYIERLEHWSHPWVVKLQCVHITEVVLLVWQNEQLVRTTRLAPWNTTTTIHGTVHLRKKQGHGIATTAASTE